MRHSFLGTIAIVAVVGCGPAQAAPETLRLAATSKWHVDYGEERCRLAREFGEGEQKVLAFFEKFGPGEAFRMTLGGQSMRVNEGRSEIWIQFGPTEAKQEIAVLNGNLGKDRALVFGTSNRLAPPSKAELAAISGKTGDEWVELSPISTERQAAIRYLEIGKPLRRPVVLETGPMLKPMMALDKCVDDLVAQWGVDVEKHKTLSRWPKPVKSPSKWIVSDDYPTNMLMAGQPAIVEFRMNIGPDGKPTACHIQQTTRPKAFDDAVCKSLMRRAEFEPALDAEGKPLASYWYNRVRFQMAN